MFTEATNLAIQEAIMVFVLFTFTEFLRIQLTEFVIRQTVCHALKQTR